MVRVNKIPSPRQQFNSWLGSPDDSDLSHPLVEELVSCCLTEDPIIRSESIFGWVIKAYQQGWLDATETIRELNDAK